MKKLYLSGITALFLTFSSLPALADNSNTIGFYSDNSAVNTGTSTMLHIIQNTTGAAAQSLVVQTDFGTLSGYGTFSTNGNGSSLTVSPNSDNSFQNIGITSQNPGIAHVQVIQNGVTIAFTTVTFLPRVQLTADSVSLAAGGATNLHIRLLQSVNPAPNIQLQTSAGTLNGIGMSIDDTPVDSVNGVYSVVPLSSNQAGTATVTAYFNGIAVATTTVNFHAGPLSNVTVKQTPPVMNSSVITITAADQYGNMVADNSAGSTFSISTDVGQLIPIAGNVTSSNGSGLSISSRNGIAELSVSAPTSSTANLTINAIGAPQSGISINGTTGNTVTIPVNLSNGSAGQTGGTSSGTSTNVTVTPFSDYQDVFGTSDRNSAIRELSYLGVLNGYPDHSFQPNAQIQRSEFAAIVARYMGVANAQSALSGSMYTPFADVPKDAWYATAVMVDASLGYIKGDGVNYYPDQSITYAEVAQILLRNLGIQSEANWPDGPVNTAKQTGLFTGIPNFDENASAARGDVAIMVRNALHVTQTSNGSGTSGAAQPLEMKTLGYAYTGDHQPAVVKSVGVNSLSGGSTLQVSVGNQAMNLNLASSVVISGGSTLTDLVNKKVHYLTNRQGLVTYIEIV